MPHLYFISWFISALFILFVSLPDWVKRRVLLDTLTSRVLVVFLWTDLTVKVVVRSRHWNYTGALQWKHALCLFLFLHLIRSGLFIYCNDTSISTWRFPQFTVIQRSLQSVPSLPPRTRRTKGCRFVHLLRCEGHRDREDVSPVNKAQPTRGALVSCCLFGISTEVLLHQTFLFKCCQHHMSARQIDWRLVYTSSPPIRRWSLKHK